MSVVKVARDANGAVFAAAACGCAVKVIGFEIALGQAVTGLLDHAARVDSGDRSDCAPLPGGAR